MRTVRPTALLVAGFLIAAPVSGAAAADVVTPSATPTASVPAVPTPVASIASPSSSASASPSATPTTSKPTSPKVTPSPTVTATPSSSVPAGAHLEVAPGEAPRLANVMLTGSCTQLAPIKWDDELDYAYGEQWEVDVTLSVDGEAINDPVLFASEYDGTFGYPVQLAGRTSATVPAVGDVVAIDVWCHEFVDEPGATAKSFHLSTSVTVNDEPTCPDALPEATGALDKDVALGTFDSMTGVGTYEGDGWLPETDVVVCYFTNPDFVDRPTPAQRFGTDVADDAGAVSMHTIGEAVDPYDPSEDGDYSGDDTALRRAPAVTADDDTDTTDTDTDTDTTDTDPGDTDAGDDTDPGDTDASGDDSGDEAAPTTAIYTVAAIGTGADGAARVLIADVTIHAVPTSGVGYDIPISGTAPTAPTLAYSGTRSGALARYGFALLVVGAFLLTVTRREDEATN